MTEPHISVISFIGTSDRSLTEAITRAERGLQNWYAQQVIVHDAAGGSIFRFSTAAYQVADQYTFVITVFDTRHT